MFNLLCVTAEFLSQSNWRRVHQMRATEFDNFPEFLSLRLQCILKTFERRHEIIPDRFAYSNMHGCRNYIVTGLSHINVVVGMHGIPGPDRFASYLAGA